jgi:UDP-3-O-[3-hydroxymyristoyl] N-acetylglucosamine deacetylase/3-hydroxyacyl-[acyl-carrier-protein] dehydratase
MAIKQRSLNKEKSVKGKALHTGEDVTLTLKPAPAFSGYVFRRTDLFGKPEIKPSSSSVT